MNKAVYHFQMKSPMDEKKEGEEKKEEEKKEEVRVHSQNTRFINFHPGQKNLLDGIKALLEYQKQERL